MYAATNRESRQTASATNGYVTSPKLAFFGFTDSEMVEKGKT
jgi:hypothetical protein